MEHRYRMLAEEIRNKASRLDWNPSNYSNSYELSLGTGHVVITNNNDLLTHNPLAVLPAYSLRFLNERGQTVHSIESDKTRADENKELLEDIYNKANNAYMQTEETLRSMLDDISNKGN